MREDTISAISTAIGEGGIAIIRVSSDRALDIVSRIFKAKNDKRYKRYEELYYEIWPYY